MALAYLLSPTFQVENSAGKPATGGWLEVFVSGSRDPYYCYSDFQGTLHPFKIPLDSLGSNVVLADDGQAYDVYAYNRYGGLLMSRYNVKPGHGAGGGGGTITSSDGSIDVTMTPTGYDLKINGQEASALRAGANDLTSDGQFVFYELVRDGENVTVDTNGKIRLQEGWYHYDITARVKWEDGVTVDNTENHIQLYTTLNSDIIPFDCSYEHEDTLHLHGQVKIATSGSQFVVGVQGIESGMSIELVDCGMFAITGHGDDTEYTAGDGIVIDDHEISVDTSVIQEKLEAGDNIVIEGNVISATAEPQQQSDWTETDTSDVSYIQHKPTVKPVVAGANITITEGNDSFTISATAEPQEQANWNETDSSSVQYIQNKPDLSVYATGAELTAGLATKQDTISDLATIRSGAALGATATQPADLAPYATTADMNTALAGKQDVISDLSTIRSGASLGATSVQPSDLSTVATTGDYDDLSDKPDLSVYATGAELTSGLATKQDVISDLSDIRSGAALGETSVQPSDLATVATTGSYDDLTDKPVIPAAQVQSDWDESDSSEPSYIQNKPDLSVYATDSELTAGLATKQDTISDLSTIRSGAAAGATAVQPSDLSTVATTGDYDDLSDKPDLSVYATGAELTAGLATKQDTISDLATIRSGAAAGATAIQPSDLATVATTGDYDDLTDKPDLSIYAESSNLATVATTGSYDDLVDKPTIPAAQVNSDWNASSGVAEILNKPTLSTVATTGDYNDLVNKPSIPAAQINSDWSESDTTSKAYIQNKPDLSVYATSSELTAGLATKQDTISDLATIRSGAEAGATAIQPSDLATVATTGDYDDLVDKPTIPSGVQLVPAATSSDAAKVLTVDAQGTPAWAASQGLFIAQYGVTTYSQVVAAIEANKIVYCRIGADWDDSRLAFLAYDAHIGPNNNVEFQYVRSNGSGSGYDSIFIYKVNSSGWTTTERPVKAGNISYPVTQVNVNGSSAMTGTVANITIPAAPTVDQTYDATSSNAQSGIAVADAISTKQDTISDLATIRSGAADGATAVQPSDLATVATTGAYSDLSGTPTIPTVDQSYSAASTNAQSGTAVAQAISAVNQVPASTSSDEGKVLTVDSNGDAGWAPAQGGSTYTAGDGIAINANAISAKVGGGIKFGTAAVPSTTTEQLYMTADDMSNCVYGFGSVSNSATALNKGDTVSVELNYDFIVDTIQGESGTYYAAIAQFANKWGYPMDGEPYLILGEVTPSEVMGSYVYFDEGLSVDYNINDISTSLSNNLTWSTVQANPGSYQFGIIRISGQGADAVKYPDTTYSYEPLNTATATIPTTVNVPNSIILENPLPASTVSDANKVLKVNASGTPEWAVGGGGGTYTAGTGIDIDQNNAISVENPLPSSTSADEGKVLKIDANGDPEWATGGGTQVQSDWTESDTTDPAYIENKPTVMGLTAGSNVTITEGVSSITIAATDTTYTAGTGISITNGAISNSDPLPSHTSTESGKVLGVDSNGGLGWVNQSGGGTTYTAGNMISLANSEIAVSTTAGITDIQQVNALPANPVATVLYLIPET